ncbi:MAG TPA: peptidylprolyl isomerase [Gemmatimonadaceae bacterium]|nr:peptidylprolyl isomerase [Gemmatimonadaceae bacterium]
MTRTPITLAAIVASVVACKGFKEAMTAHVDVAAKAGAQELSSQRLASLLSQVKVPVTPEIAKAITNIWTDYQLLGQAAAHNDSLNDKALVDSALWPVISQRRAGKWHDQLVKSWGIDTAGNEAKYATGAFLAARHILFVVPQGASPATKDSVHKHALEVRAQLTPANFAAMASKYSQEPGAQQRGGDLGVFPKGAMVKDFETAVLALQPGQISPPILTQFGYHIIYRRPYAEVKEEFAQRANEPALRAADSTYIDRLEKSGNIVIQPGAAAAIKSAAHDIDAHRTDKTVLATSNAGSFTVARMARWLLASPQGQELSQRLPQATDSQTVSFLKNLLRNELVLHQADSAKVELTPAEMDTLRKAFADLVTSRWEQLNVSPPSLADSGKTEAARERIAAARVDDYLDKLMQQQARFVDVPPPLEEVLRDRYPAKVNQTGVERAIESATKMKATADSTKAKNRPPSEVPLGPTKPGGAAPAPTPAPPAPPAAPPTPPPLHTPR